MIRGCFQSTAEMGLDDDTREYCAEALGALVERVRNMLLQKAFGSDIGDCLYLYGMLVRIWVA